METVSDGRYTEVCNPLGEFLCPFDFEIDGRLNSLSCSCVCCVHVRTGLNHWLCPYFQKSADSKMQGRGWPCDIWILSVWTVSWKLRLSCRHVTIKRNFDSFQTGYLEKALISQSFIYEPHRGPLHAYMNVTFKTERMSREVLDDCLTISLEQNYNLSQHIKEVKASQCHPLLMYKKRQKKRFSSLISKTLL